MKASLRLHLDRLDARSAPVDLPAARARALYVVDGSLALRAGDATGATLGPNSAISLAGPGAIGGGSSAVTVLRWELTEEGGEVVGSGAAANTVNTAGSTESAESRLLLAASLTLNPAERWILRCDRVDFPPGGQALLHTHQGGGIRCLLTGSIRIDTEGTSHRYGPLEAWFEAGPDSVFAQADIKDATAFARVMILPARLIGGKSSIQYLNAEDMTRPKSQRYQVFIDEGVGIMSRSTTPQSAEIG